MISDIWEDEFAIGMRELLQQALLGLTVSDKKPTSVNLHYALAWFRIGILDPDTTLSQVYVNPTETISLCHALCQTC